MFKSCFSSEWGCASKHTDALYVRPAEVCYLHYYVNLQYCVTSPLHRCVCLSTHLRLHLYRSRRRMRSCGVCCSRRLAAPSTWPTCRASGAATRMHAATLRPWPSGGTGCWTRCGLLGTLCVGMLCDTTILMICLAGHTESAPLQAYTPPCGWGDTRCDTASLIVWQAGHTVMLHAQQPGWLLEEQLMISGGPWCIT
jgi:hypothetical protein